ncbi:pentapeptide repeat-containing protein [Niallia nealsonii]|uniref:Pentapeptide repeat-containing protein n=1 Tax=Niallia nealsonii TaxID=115979 RepID=A0A2N0Z1T7_9BACI|nr:pentapeptide repeat-containing protein [Niallia nealsonii]PKG23474.1 hypothetical protein CWS01_11785 [Niallia nealsonii]
MLKEYHSDCTNCFGLCCVALPYAKSSDFAFSKDGGTPCSNLQTDNKCRIHTDLREKGFRGCTAYECFGAGQKVSQHIYSDKDWRDYPELSIEMFNVFPIVQQLHEMLYYLNQALTFSETKSIHVLLQNSLKKTEELTFLSPEEILALDIPAHRATVNEVLLQASELVRKTSKSTNKKKNRMDYLGANLKGADFRGMSLRGALLIAANLRGADLRKVDFIGADMRDADLSGANLTESIFLTQAQVNAAIGDRHTKLPKGLTLPSHWQ